MTITEPLAVTARREVAGAWLAGFEAAIQAGTPALRRACSWPAATGATSSP